MSAVVSAATALDALTPLKCPMALMEAVQGEIGGRSLGCWLMSWPAVCRGLCHLCRTAVTHACCIHSRGPSKRRHSSPPPTHTNKPADASRRLRDQRSLMSELDARLGASASQLSEARAAGARLQSAVDDLRSADVTLRLPELEAAMAEGRAAKELAEGPVRAALDAWWHQPAQHAAPWIKREQLARGTWGRGLGQAHARRNDWAGGKGCGRSNAGVGGWGTRRHRCRSRGALRGGGLVVLSLARLPFHNAHHVRPTPRPHPIPPASLPKQTRAAAARSG